jgi:methylated-DNA-protein-cysteine methyltransferase-like protein
VLDAVDAIPSGRVSSYGDVARRADTGSARLVGAILARRGHEVPWHRVVMADGRPAPHHAREQLARLRAEGVVLTAGGTKVDLTRSRWRPASAD